MESLYFADSKKRKKKKKKTINYSKRIKRPQTEEVRNSKRKRAVPKAAPKVVAPAPKVPKATTPIFSSIKIVGNTRTRSTFQVWIQRHQKIALLHGPTGVGKSLTAHQYLRRFHVVDILSEQHQIADVIVKLRTVATKVQSKTTPTAVVIDGLDLLPKKDIAAVVRLLKKLKKITCPIVCIVNSKYAVKTLAAISTCFPFYRLAPTEIKTCLLNSNVKLSDSEMVRICENSNGDARKALNDARFATVCSVADVVNTPFDTTKSLFAGRPVNMDNDDHLVRAFIDENALRFCNTVGEIDQLTEFLSDLNIISPTYPSDLTKFGSSLCSKFIRKKRTSQVHFPTFFGQLSKQKGNKKALASLQMTTSVTPIEISLLTPQTNTKKGLKKYFLSFLDNTEAERLSCLGLSK
jgi:DNA polymerase III delta prime subunit